MKKEERRLGLQMYFFMKGLGPNPLRSQQKIPYYFEINISCPNTPEGQQMAKHPELLLELIKYLRTKTDRVIGSKLSPDLSNEQLKKFAEMVMPFDKAYVNVGNTTYRKCADIGLPADAISIGDSVANVAVTDAQWSVTGPGAATFVSLNLGTTTLLDVLSTTSSIDFGATAANTCEESAAITLTGAAVGDSVHVGTPAAPAANSAIWGYVSAADAVRVRRCNVSIAALADPAVETYRITVTKF